MNGRAIKWRRNAYCIEFSSKKPLRLQDICLVTGSKNASADESGLNWLVRLSDDADFAHFS